MKALRAYKYKLKTNAKFVAGCSAALNACRELYNAAIQERRDAYRINGVSINYHACGHRVRKTLDDREHRCDNCGFVAHRDHNSAIVIKGRAGLSGMVPVGESREPRISTYNAALGV